MRMRYKAGDKVVIINQRGKGWNLSGEMDIWQGKVMTISKKSVIIPWVLARYKMVEDGGIWAWDNMDIDYEATKKLGGKIMEIKDSGNRTQFNTGAVRDMSEGKGRMDLLCWNAIIEVSKHCEEGAKKYGENNVDKGIPMHSLADSAMRHMAKFIAGHKDEDHLRAAAWNILWALEFRETKPELNDLYYWKGEDQCSETGATIAE